MNQGPAIPANINISDLDLTKELMNKIMKKYIDQVRAEPKQFIKERSAIDKLLGRHPPPPTGEGRKFPVMYPDKFVPSFQ